MLGPDPMSAEEHLLMQEVIERCFGLGYAARDRDRLESKLQPRLRQLHLRRFTDYYLQLEVDPVGELPILAALITNNETYFFRETYQFEGLLHDGLGVLGESGRRGDALRVLSVGCSSGEEPYTLSMFADRHRESKDPGFRISIDGFDLDAARIEAARRAVYGPTSLRSTSDEQRRRYFRETKKGEQWELRSFVRRGVSFRVGNLLEMGTYGPPQSWDVILCRNVLIYFSEGAFRQAIGNFARALRPGGLLFLGHSESLIGRETPFETMRLEDCIAYRRGAGG